MLDRLTLKGFNNGQISNTLKFLENSGLVNDKALSKELLRNAVERKLLGRKGIQMFLYKRGINRTLTDETLLGHTEEMEKEAALKLVDKKLKVLKKYPENILKRRLWGMLRRRGFSADIINMAVKSIKLKK